MGAESKLWGDAAEQAAEVSFRSYEAHERLCWTKTYPKTTVTNGNRGGGQWDGWGQPEKTVKLTGEGPPDYCLALKGFGGRLMWLEVKEWKEPVKGKNQGRYVLEKRIHQYLTMKDFISAGAFGAYLVAWRQPDDTFEWRLHPVLWLARDERGRIIFVKSEGLPVDSRDNWPDWLPQVVAHAGFLNLKMNLAAKEA